MSRLLLKSPKALRDDKGQKQAGHAFACGYMRATFLGYLHTRRQDYSTAGGSASESPPRTPIFKKGFENPRNLREGSLSGQRQSGCGSSSRVERARATRCCGLSARVCVVCVLFPYVQSELQKHHPQDSLILCYHQIDSRSI